jgi:hypothetical protein
LGVVKLKNKKTFVIIAGCYLSAGTYMTKLGNPEMGICVAVFHRDITGALGFHS